MLYSRLVNELERFRHEVIGADPFVIVVPLGFSHFGGLQRVEEAIGCTILVGTTSGGITIGAKPRP